MENRHQHHHSSGFGNGFLLGLIFGVVIALLFTTKKGKEILRTLTEKSLEKVSGLEEKMNGLKEEFEDSLEGDDFVEPALEQNIADLPAGRQGVSEHAQKIAKQHEEASLKGEIPPKPSTGHRLFKGLKKKS